MAAHIHMRKAVIIFLTSLGSKNSLIYIFKCLNNQSLYVTHVYLFEHVNTSNTGNSRISIFRLVEASLKHASLTANSASHDNLNSSTATGILHSEGTLFEFSLGAGKFLYSAFKRATTAHTHVYYLFTPSHLTITRFTLCN
jgi:hypothetical protein